MKTDSVDDLNMFTNRFFNCDRDIPSHVKMVCTAMMTEHIVGQIKMEYAVLFVLEKSIGSDEKSVFPFILSE